MKRFAAFYPSHFDCEWNKAAALATDGLQYLEYNKPIFMLSNTTEIDILLEDVRIT